jgi:mono/diheme cytochrome c family protein
MQHVLSPMIAALLVVHLPDIAGGVDNSVPLIERPVLRHPVAMVSGTQGLVLVANRNTGTVSVLTADGDGTASRSSVHEFRLSERLDDLVRVSSTVFAGVDSTRHELLTFEFDGRRARQVMRQAVAQYPVSVIASSDGAVLCVASLWSRRLSLFQVEGLEPLAVIDLPFAPLRQCFLNETHLLVADAFAGRLAVIDVRQRRMQSYLAINGHNIRGLSLNSPVTGQSNDVLITHQILNAASSTTRSMISWGGVISNTLHTIAIPDLLESTSVDLEKPDRIHGRLYPLGEQGRAAGDPGAIVTEAGDTWIALTGVGEVALRRGSEHSAKRQSVCRRPTCLLIDGQELLVLSTSDESVTVVDRESLIPQHVIQLGPPVVRTLAQQGEELFFDARLSLDGWFSCHSCHSDGHTMGRLNDNLGDETFNTPKRVLTLRGTGPTEPWGWNGSQNDLHDQVSKSIELTMAGPGKSGPRITDREIKSIVSYISSLSPVPGILTARQEAGQPGVERGRQVFLKFGCSDCHQPPFYTSPLSHDVGVKDEWGLHYFNPPSLLGVSQRESYFHDNRATRLIDVFLDHDHDNASSLSEKQIDDLVLFLQSL